MLSAKATCNSHGQDSSYFLGWEEYEKNPYHPIDNPTGMIQMGLAENQLSFDLLESWLHDNPNSASFTAQSSFSFREIALFQDYHGLPAFKNALADFMSEIRENKVSFNPNNLVLTAGATSANETLMFCLADPGDAFLLPTPYYPGDEIYSGTVFSSPGFVSILEVLKNKDLMNSDVAKRVHIVYSLSKDLGLPGFRIGAIYSNDNIVVSAATKMSSFGLISSQTQYLLSQILSDKKFTNNYLTENRRRLKQRHEMLEKLLQKAGIRCLKSNAGLFSWVDMRCLLSAQTFEGEMELWKKIVYEVGLNISPGSSCHCSEPGWFRVCFANMSEETLALAMQRLSSFVDSMVKKADRSGHRPVDRSARRSKSLPKWGFFAVLLHRKVGEERCV
ncbi:hypothetical protein E3N88_12402 [Mikania micrantha]|uniref:Aminotransferase class I/classII large domain-containing protein n=1 Tax=Mikania micrantha TaxID=192012 RepID=A0A5N6P5R9_9ASTR|nr:hypothetical protein E3N88_12402 [Mikania micrantha]